MGHNSSCRRATVLGGGGHDEDVRAVDLLLVLTKAAAQSARASTILRPFPKPAARGGPFSNKFDRAKIVAEAMPRAVSLMIDDHACDAEDKSNATSASNLQAESKQADVAAAATTSISPRKSSRQRLSLSFKTGTKHKNRTAAFATAEWAATTSPAKIIPLSTGERFLGGMGTSYQFLLKYKGQSARERKFRNARNRGGTTLAWHGSRVENWHSIFRNGLKVYSGTEQQANGAVYGNGIYVSPYSSTSLGYCGSCWKYSGIPNSTANANPQQAGWGDEVNPDELMTSDKVFGLRVLALCEITGTVKKAAGSVWVVKSAGQIVVRALFVIPNNGTPSVTAETLRTNLKKIAKAHSL
jgi:hypothetical protein